MASMHQEFHSNIFNFSALPMTSWILEQTPCSSSQQSEIRSHHPNHYRERIIITERLASDEQDLLTRRAFNFSETGNLCCSLLHCYRFARRKLPATTFMHFGPRWLMLLTLGCILCFLSMSANFYQPASGILRRSQRRNMLTSTLLHWCTVLPKQTILQGKANWRFIADDG